MQFLYVQLEAAVASEANHGLLLGCERDANCRWQSKAHRAHAA